MSSVRNYYQQHSEDSVDIILHLGVAGSSKSFRLEKFAYNKEDFAIPDNDGQQPKNEKIDEFLPLDTPLECKFDLKSVCDALRDLDYLVKISDDPGRYICNFTYFLA